MRSTQQILNLNLFQHYQNHWPAQANELHAELSTCADISTLKKFKHTIQNTSHPHRFTTIQLTPPMHNLPGSRFVYESAEFKQLNRILDQRLVELECTDQASIEVLQIIIQLFKSIDLRSLSGLIGIVIFAFLIGNASANTTPHFSDNNSANQITNAKNIPAKYANIPMMDASHQEKFCYQKSDGASEGKICIMNSTKFFMKKIKPADKNENNDPVVGEFNRRFLVNNVGIKVSPETQFFCMKEKKENKINCYYASKEIKSFREALALCLPNKRGYAWCDYDRTKVVEHIGETAIAQFAVANTFIKDLHARNWGFVKNKVCEESLMIIDADQALTDLPHYISHAVTKFNNTGMKEGLGIPLTLGDIQRMCDIYIAMQEKPVTVFHESVDMPESTYQALVSIFLDACNQAIAIISNNKTIHDNNRVLASCINKTGILYLQNNTNEVIFGNNSLKI